MTSTNLRLAAAGLAALLGLGLGAAPSAAATELVPFHAGHDHGKSKAEKPGKAAEKDKKSEKSGKQGKGKRKGKGGHGHAGHKH